MITDISLIHSRVICRSYLLVWFRNVLDFLLIFAGRCRVDIKAWGQTGDAADGYIRVTDLLTNYVDEFTANVTGDYLATIDMSNCSVTNRNYAQWSQVAQNGQLYNTWNSASAGVDFKNILGVELGVGPGQTSYAPWILMSNLGLDEPVPAFSNNRYHGLSALLSGKYNVQWGILFGSREPIIHT